MLHKRKKRCIFSEEKEFGVVDGDLVLKFWIKKDVKLFVIFWANVEWYVECDSFSSPNVSEVFVQRHICQIYRFASLRAQHNAVKFWQILFCHLNAGLDCLTILV